MLELWVAQRGYAGTFVCSRGGMPEVLWAQGGGCRNYCGLGGGYAGTSVGLGGGMPEPLWAQGGYPGKFGG